MWDGCPKFLLPLVTQFDWGGVTLASVGKSHRELKGTPMKKAIGGVVAALLLLTACGADDSTSEDTVVFDSNKYNKRILLWLEIPF